jgi:plasmid stability protein
MMNTQTVTVHLPEGLYSQLRERAERWNRSIEAEMLDMLSSAMPSGPDLPAHIEEELSRLDLADDEAIRLAAQSHLSAEVAHQLEELHWKRQKQGLTEVETTTLANLVDQYERAMLTRAHAAALWKRRGHDPSELITSG